MKNLKFSSEGEAAFARHHSSARLVIASLISLGCLLASGHASAGPSMDSASDKPAGGCAMACGTEVDVSDFLPDREGDPSRVEEFFGNAPENIFGVWAWDEERECLMLVSGSSLGRRVGGSGKYAWRSGHWEGRATWVWVPGLDMWTTRVVIVVDGFLDYPPREPASMRGRINFPLTGDSPLDPGKDGASRAEFLAMKQPGRTGSFEFGFDFDDSSGMKGRRSASAAAPHAPLESHEFAEPVVALRKGSM